MITSRGIHGAAFVNLLCALTVAELSTESHHIVFLERRGKT
jgi:hypothetical protein